MKKQITVQGCVYVFLVTLIIACTGNNVKKQFEISGVIRNNNQTKIYLEELPAGGSEGKIVDSFLIDKEGKYKLKTEAKEALLYGLRFNQDDYPIAYVINDSSKIAVDIELDPQHNRFADKYEIRHSPASMEVKQFATSFDNDLQKLYFISRQGDSIQQKNPDDTLLIPLKEEWQATAGKIKESALTAINKADNPALLLFELGYLAAINKRFYMPPLHLEEEVEILDKAATRFPDHKGLAEIRKERNDQLAQLKRNSETEAKWVGKPAPDFSLPDINGKEVTLRSFRGQFVLVDFWASWCGPCRDENPNVVKAFNKFRDKNFTVLGVSLDKPGQKDQWLKAIQKDHLTWTHVSDLKWWESSVVPLYNLNGIPYNVLVDTAGIVIGENLKGYALDAKLQEVLK